MKKRWARLRKNEKQFLLLVIGPLLLIGIISIITLLLSDSETALITQFILGAIWTFSIGSYIVFVDSKSRWPEANAFDRLANLVTFKR